MWRSIAGLALAFVLSAVSCARSTASGESASSKPDEAPLPDAINLCVNAVAALPAKPDGKRWDCCGGGQFTATEMGTLAAAAATGGLAGVQAISAAGSLISSGTSAPELQVSVYLDNRLKLVTPKVQDSTQAHWVSQNCIIVPRAQYGGIFRVIVQDVDLQNHDLVGQRTLAGIPDEAIRAKIWRLSGFGSVVELEFVLTPALSVQPRGAQMQ